MDALEGSTDLQMLESQDFENISTPSIRSRILQLEAEDHSENIYKGCCDYSTDKRLLILGSQIGFSSMILLWCGTMIALKEKNSDTGLEMSLISSILSYWFGRSNELGKK